MLTRIFLTASLALVAAAAPTATTSSTVKSRAVSAREAYAFSPELAAFYSAVSQEIDNVKSSTAYQNDAFACDMNVANEYFPTAPTPLPSPAANSSLKHVLLGMGTQNYTCPSTATNTSAVPTAIGAFANLFNVSCIAANYASLLYQLPVLAYQYQLPSTYFPPEGTIGVAADETPGENYTYQPLNLLYSGLHTFHNLTTPQFNLSLPSPEINDGLVWAKKANSSAAWANATQGQYGAVTYLKLDAIDGTVGGYTNVYRMLTQGGANPATCGTQTGEFSIPYSALYYFYGK